MNRSFALLRTHPEGRLCGIRLGSLYIYVFNRTLHFWRRGTHKYWTLERMRAR